MVVRNLTAVLGNLLLTSCKVFTSRKRVDDLTEDKSDTSDDVCDCIYQDNWFYWLYT